MCLISYTMKHILVVADIGWAIGRIHKDIERAFGSEYKFLYLNSSNIHLEILKQLFYTCDLCLTTLNLHSDLVRLFPSPRELSKLMFVCHGYSEITKENVMYKYVTYGAVSDILVPFFPTMVHVVPNGVDMTSFTRRPCSGVIRGLGWCGAPRISVKRFDMALHISHGVKLPLSIASGLTYDDLKDWYHTIDVLLVTSGPEPRVETGPLPPFEAIASGIVVIGTPVGNFRYVPGPKFHTVEEAVVILQTLCEYPNMVRRLAEEQYAWVATHWDYAVLVDSWRVMFESALQKCALIT